MDESEIRFPQRGNHIGSLASGNNTELSSAKSEPYNIYSESHEPYTEADDLDKPKTSEDRHTIHIDLQKQQPLSHKQTPSNQQDHTIETIGSKGNKIQIDVERLDKIKQKYRISDWDIQFDPRVSLSPSRVNWKERRVVIRPFNLWSYLSAGFSNKKRAAVLPKLFAHELRHTQQKAPDDSLRGTLLAARFMYWFHPLEIDARKWAAEHYEEFTDLIKVDQKL